MTLRSPVFSALAAIYEDSQAGRTGRGLRDVQPTFTELDDEVFRQTKRRLEGEAHELAVEELCALDKKVLLIEWDNPRAQTTIHKVRLSPRDEAAFFAALGRESPVQRRARWSALFREAREWPVTGRFVEEWRLFCAHRAERSLHWDGMKPLHQHGLREGRALLETTLCLLGWESPAGGSLIRWVSSHLCGRSKTLETKQKSRELLLREASGGRIADFERHGILPMPREARISGPLRLRIRGQVVDCGTLEVTTLLLDDLQQAELVDCRATRCLTVENKTVFLDLARKCSGELLVWTSFPNAATLTLLALLPATLEYYHFGDTDPSGFHILHDLCRQTQRAFLPFRMRAQSSRIARQVTAPERTLLKSLLASPHLISSRNEIARMLETGEVGAFEQEEHQPAPLSQWPFYLEICTEGRNSGTGIHDHKS